VSAAARSPCSAEAMRVESAEFTGREAYYGRVGRVQGPLHRPMSPFCGRFRFYRQERTHKGAMTVNWNRTKSTALVAALISGLAAAAHADDKYPLPTVPGDIEAPAGLTLFLVGYAVGTQNYMCVGGDWFFLGPQATVYDLAGEQIATHFLSRNPQQADALQATWQHSRDSSMVWGRKFTGAPAPGNAIEWLLLEVTGQQYGPLGGGKLAGTRAIQRINTEGGVKPPVGDCATAPTGTRRYVPYKAEYYFYR
jgi:hypothetical protein